MRAMLGLSLVVFGPVAYAIWWRALDAAEGPLRMSALSRMAGWF
ncbi:hypothetical protein [Gymnodinialimonas ulvae]